MMNSWNGSTTASASVRGAVRESLGSERAYLRRTLPAGIARGVAGTVRDPAGVARAGAILLGAAAAAFGGLVEVVHR